MSFSHTPQPISPLQRYVPTLLAILILLACIERIYGIDRQSLWSDELFAITASFKPTWASLWSLLVSDSHPPGYVLFMYWTLPLSGYSDIGIRLHALLFGVLWIPLVYWVGKRWFGDWAALFAAAILVSGYNAIYYSQEARAYTMLVAFNLINIGCFFEILFGQSPQRRHISGFILSTLAMLYLHYAGFVFLSAEILLYAILWFLQQRKGSVREAAKIFGIPLLLYLPWLGIMYHHMVNAPQDWSVSAAPTLSEGLN
ncbi:MAG TPA: glycosyltransferase family 39 protein, partial [Pseudomonadales bacterium]|nr:glycosyltransferase family 39 protein [Pseudomonadales bacterium]